MRRTRFGQEKQSFSIRKYSLGAASVLIGTSLVFGLQDVKADEQVGTVASGNLPLVQVEEKSLADKPKSEPVQLTDETQKVASQTEGQVSAEETSQTSQNLTSKSQVSSETTSQEKSIISINQESLNQATTVVETTRTLPVTVTSPPAQASTPTGQLTIQNQTSTGFDIEISNVSDGQGIKAVKVPVWSEQDGQNDIVWYDAVRQANGNYKVSVSLTTHKNEQGVYHAHLYYVENDGKLVGVTTTQTKASVAGSSQATQVEKLADQGTYHFTKQVAVKNEAKEGAITQFTFEKGEKVNYDKKIESDGHQWISYLSYSGVRRYVDLGKVSSSVQSVAGQPVTTQTSTPTGQLTIQNQTSTGFDIEISNISDSKGIKSVKVPVWSEQEGQNDIVWYDAVRQANGNYKVSVSLTKHKNEQGVYHAHLYYVENDGKLVGVTTTQTKASVAGSSQATQVEKLADQGTYHFTKQVAVKNEAKEGAITQFTFEKGEKVNYDKKIESDGHQWISYLSYSGVRRYVDLGKVSSSVQSIAGQPVTTQTSTPTGQLTIQNQTSTGFDIEVSNISDSKGIKSVRVPVWADQNGQNDIIWYDAVKQSNGNYKVSVSLSDHKNEQGLYYAHLYYVETDGKLVGVATTQAKIESKLVKSEDELPSQGTYHFTKQAEVKNEAKTTAPTQFTFEKGDKVNYDKVIQADNHQWISYVSYSGTRRYVKIDN